MRRLTTMFPPEFLEEHAEELGVVERESREKKATELIDKWMGVYQDAIDKEYSISGTVFNK